MADNTSDFGLSLAPGEDNSKFVPDGAPFRALGRISKQRGKFGGAEDDWGPTPTPSTESDPDQPPSLVYNRNY